jgi:hypothetical protein
MPILPPTNTLQTIQQKVRRLTRSPSISVLTDFDLNQYINTFVIYDFPEQLRTFNLRQQFTFVCNAFQDVYNTDEISYAGAITNDLYNFQNLYLSIHEPVYIAGYQSFFSQSPEQFFAIYPNVNSISTIGVMGDGVTQTFTGVVNSNQAILVPGQVQTAVLLQNNVLFSSIDSTGIGVAMQDVPVVDTVTGFNFPIGNLYAPGNLPATPPTAVLANNNINYITGQFTVTFPRAPGSMQTINSQTVFQSITLPQALLFYQNQFTLRPVPDQPYRVNFEVYIRPVALLETNQSPQLEEWWQYIAYGASRKILQDRLDLDTVALLEPEFRKQENLCNRRTIVQYTNERTATIYTEQVTTLGSTFGGWGTGGGTL